MTDSGATLYGFDVAPATWRKSSSSAGEHECVEIADLADSRVAVRDSKRPEGKVLRFTGPEWAAFQAGLRAGTI
ncbi:DUF397 domain-containing protein [Streptomyces oceani]|uniref:DUF397 domain-containing protein n=1 Tax=Streptomyces oceani TaxID=1075402 RepID=A0A1E7JZC2_9ACTN|nr:DUF397 domain-containing protein [Streptomyces oceani]OEU97037.1 hypothetical protein AN216_17430 [Streptomyces oceani]